MPPKKRALSISSSDSDGDLSPSKKPASNPKQTQVKLKLCTWNCQRRSLTDGTFKPALDHLMSQTYQVIFFQELPLALRRSDFDTEFPGYISVLPSATGTQSSSSGCFNLLLVEKTLVKKSKSAALKSRGLNSGSDQASRYPAALTIEIHGFQGRFHLFSVHATSGGGGRGNSSDLIDEITIGKEEDTTLVGADFNHSSEKGQLAAGLTEGYLRPNASNGSFLPTHGSNDRHTGVATYSALDGFYIHLGEYMEAVIMQRPQLAPGFTITSHGGQTGCFYSGNRVSDHAPIETELQVIETEPEDEF